MYAYAYAACPAEYSAVVTILQICIMPVFMHRHRRHRRIIGIGRACSIGMHHRQHHRQHHRHRHKHRQHHRGIIDTHHRQHRQGMHYRQHYRLYRQSMHHRHSRQYNALMVDD